MNLKTLTLVMLPALSFTAAADVTNDNTETFDTITVNAKGLEERPQDVPFTVNVVDGEELDHRQYDSIKEAITYVPGVSLHNSGDAYDGIWIRGTGSMSQTMTLDDNSVGINIDGLSLGKVGLTQNIFDIEQVEVTKGPQGTVFGSNTEAGAINIKTNDPEFIAGGRVDISVADNNLRKITAVANTPLSDTVALRISGLASTRDSYIHKRETDKPLNDQGNRGVRAKLLWQPSESTQAMVTAFHDSRSNYYPIALTRPFKKENPLYTTGKVPHHSDRETNGVNLDITHSLNDRIKFTSNTAYAKHKADFEKSALPFDVFAPIYGAMNPAIPTLLQQPAYNTQKQFDDIQFFEQDFRLSSQPESDIKWVSGLYLSNKKRDFTYNATNQYLQPDPLNAKLHRDYTIQTQALYGEVTVPVTQKTNVLTGLRVTKESNEMNALYTPNATPTNPFAAGGNKKENKKLDDTFVTWRLGSDYEVAPEWRVYGLYSKGHKSQGFADFDTNIAYNKATPKYKAGDIQTFEMGFKGAAEDGTWQANIAAFKNNTKDDKVTVTTFTPFSSTPYNVDSTAQGIEFDGQLNVTSNLQLKTALAHIDTEVTKVPDTAQTVVKKGNTMPHTPKWSGALGMEYNYPVTGIKYTDIITTKLDINYADKRAAEPNNKLILDAYTTLDASVGVSGSYGDVSLWAKNLTNEERVLIGVERNGTSFGLPAEGRVIGMSYGIDF